MPNVPLTFEDVNELITDLELDMDPVDSNDNTERALLDIILAMDKKRDEQLRNLVENIVQSIENGTPTNDLYNSLANIRE